jgi:DNA-binding transcriptional ArsR family regulator
VPTKIDCLPAMKALAEENRLRLMRLLLAGTRSVNDLAEATGMSQYNVSKHLRILREAGLLAQEKQGQQRLYTVAPAIAEHLADNASVLDLGCCQFDFKKLAM